MRFPLGLLAQYIGRKNAALTEMALIIAAMAYGFFFIDDYTDVIAMGVLNRSQRDISATRASVIYMIEPVVAAICAMLFTGEAMTARKAAGGAIILLGNLACELMGRQAPEEKTA